MAQAGDRRPARRALGPASALLAALLAAALSVAPAACTARGTSSSSEPARVDASAASRGPTAGTADPIAELRPFEEESRRQLDFAKPPSAETGLGADPWAVRRVAGGWVGILRGRSAVVLLDEELREIARAPSPRSPTGLAVTPGGDVLVTGDLSPLVARFEASTGKRSLVARGETRVRDVLGLRDVAIAPSGEVWALDERGGQLLRLGLVAPSAGAHALAAKGRVLARTPVGHGTSQLIATTRHVIVNAVADHELVVLETSAAGAPLAREPLRIRHDGPMWGFDARETDAGLILVAGGVEDHPLDRTAGFFGYIDSFLFAYRVTETGAESLAAINVSAHGVVTPKALVIESAGREGGGGGAAEPWAVDVRVTGYGSDGSLRASLRKGEPPGLTSSPLVPGVRAIDRAGPVTVMADPLLDAWLLENERGVAVVPVPEPARAEVSRLGEALFFTTLMAPGNASEGAHSRFTCETCHFEGYGDGRTHHTGREDIHATTKPLVGLVGNRPYFSRALDPDLSTIAHAEFRVAGAGSGSDPFFSVEPRDHPWLTHLGLAHRVAPLELRRALMRYLVDLSHRPNPAILGRSHFDGAEATGARLFRDRCEGCHAARLSADDPASRIAFEQWEESIFAEASPVVWGSAGLRKTGIVPYVSPEGARTPSLRRLYKKHPYFTNGSARSLDEVLDRIRYGGGEMLHAAPPTPPSGAPMDKLDDATKRALRAFLDLL